MQQITVLQSAILASKVNAPSVYDVNNMSSNYTNRVKANLEKMKQQDFITDEQYKSNVTIKQLIFYKVVYFHHSKVESRRFCIFKRFIVNGYLIFNSEQMCHNNIN